MSENRQRQFNAAVMAVVYPVLGILPGFFYSFEWFPGLPLVLFVLALFAGAKSLGEALESLPDVRRIAVVLYVPVMIGFLWGSIMLFFFFFHWMWAW
jgi:hypothetical protein